MAHAVERRRTLLAIEVDVVNVDQVSATAAAAVAAVGSVDILVNNAGGANDAGFPTPRTGVWDRTLGVSAVPCCAQPLFPALSCRFGVRSVYSRAVKASTT
jgi:NAD(P)-dependent dehydrogenase (short-subunit alcohol dehydrogenase family)